MAMTTTVEKILQKAQEFEDNARALRLAASLLNGHVRETKREALERTLAGARQLRQEQRNGDTPHEEMTDDAARAFLARYLSEAGPSRISDVADALEKQGHAASITTTRKLLRSMSNVTLVGHLGAARWQLTGAPDGAPAIAGILARTKRRKALSWTERKHASRNKAEKLAIILKEAGRPLLTEELATAAREVGITSLTGIFGYVRRGWITRSGKTKGKFKYAFKQLPSAEGGEATA